MKKNTIVLFGMLSLLLPACDKATGEAALSSFVALAEDYPEEISWHVGDVIRMSNGAAVADYRYDDATGKFVTDHPLEKTGMLQGIYPADRAQWTEAGFQIILPEETTARKDGQVTVPMYLWRQSEEGFRFRSILGKVRVALVGSGTALYDAPLSEVVFSSTGLPPCGRAAVGKDGSLSFEESSQTFIVKCEEGMTVRTPAVFMLPAHKYPMGSSITFRFADGKELTTETIMGIVPRRGMTKAYDLEITADYFGPLEEYEDGGSIDDHFAE